MFQNILKSLTNPSLHMHLIRSAYSNILKQYLCAFQCCLWNFKSLGLIISCEINQSIASATDLRCLRLCLTLQQYSYIWGKCPNNIMMVVEMFVVVHSFQGIDRRRLRFLFQKELKNSDVSSLRRMILPKVVILLQIHVFTTLFVCGSLSKPNYLY